MSGAGVCFRSRARNQRWCNIIFVHHSSAMSSGRRLTKRYVSPSGKTERSFLWRVSNSKINTALSVFTIPSGNCKNRNDRRSHVGNFVSVSVVYLRPDMRDSAVAQNRMQLHGIGRTEPVEIFVNLVAWIVVTHAVFLFPCRSCCRLA